MKEVVFSKTTILHKSCGQVFTTSILLDRKKKTPKVTVNRKAENKGFLCFRVGTVSKYCCDRFPNQKNKYLKKLGQKMSAHFFDSVQKPRKTVFNFWIQQNCVKRQAWHCLFLKTCPQVQYKIKVFFFYAEPTQKREKPRIHVFGSNGSDFTFV